MRVFLFRLFPRGINLMNLCIDPVRLVLSHLFIPSFDALFLFGCMLTTRFLMHAFNSDLSIHMCLSLHATWHSPLVGEFPSPLDPHVQILELRACGFSRLLIRVRSECMDHRQTSPGPYPSRPPCLFLEFSLCNS